MRKLWPSEGDFVLRGTPFTQLSTHAVDKQRLSQRWAWRRVRLWMKHIQARLQGTEVVDSMAELAGMSEVWVPWGTCCCGGGSWRDSLKQRLEACCWVPFKNGELILCESWDLSSQVQLKSVPLKMCHVLGDRVGVCESAHCGLTPCRARAIGLCAPQHSGSPNWDTPHGKGWALEFEDVIQEIENENSSLTTLLISTTSWSSFWTFGAKKLLKWISTVCFYLLKGYWKMWDDVCDVGVSLDGELVRGWARKELVGPDFRVQR